MFSDTNSALHFSVLVDLFHLLSGLLFIEEKI